MIWCRQGLGGLPRWSRHQRQKKLGPRLLPPIIVHFVDIVDQRRQPASISSDPCPAGAFERLHHTLIRIFPPDQQLVVVTTSLPSFFVKTSVAIFVGSGGVGGYRV